MSKSVSSYTTHRIAHFAKCQQGLSAYQAALTGDVTDEEKAFLLKSVAHLEAEKGNFPDFHPGAF